MGPQSPSSPEPRDVPEPLLRRAGQWVTRPSLRGKILGIVLISGIVPALVVLGLANLGLRRAIEQGVGQFLMSRGESIAHQIDQRLAEEIDASRTLARDGRLRALLEAQPVPGRPLPPLPPDLIADFQSQGVLFVADRERRILSRIGSPSPAEREALSHLSSVDQMPGDVHLFDHHLPGREPGGVIFIASISSMRGEVVGHQFRRLEMAALVEPSLPRGLPNFYLSVVNQRGLPVSPQSIGREQQMLFDGLLVNHPDSVEAWDTAVNASGLRQVLTFHRLRGLAMLATEGRASTNWYVLSGFDLGTLLGDLEFQLWIVGLTGLLAVAFFLLIALLLTQRIIRPLRLLRADVRGIAAGRFGTRVDIRTNDEIEDLATSVNVMASRLQATYDDLGAKVRELRVRTDQLETLGIITRSITAKIDREDLLATFEREVQRLVEIDALWVALALPGRAALEIVRSSSDAVEPPAEMSVGVHLPVEGSLTGRPLTDRRTLIVADLLAASEARHEDKALRLWGLRSVMAVPLATQAGTIGVVGFGSHAPTHFGEVQAHLLSQVCEQLGVGIEHARLYNDLRQLADELEDKVAERTGELEAAQSSLIQAEKLAAMGRLAANIAHEINNPLGIIKNYTHLLMDSIQSPQSGDRDELSMENLQVITEEIDRIARIVRNLLDICRTPQPHLEQNLVHINAEIDSIVRLVQGSLEQRGIALHLDLGQDLPHIPCSSDLVRQVFLRGRPHDHHRGAKFSGRGCRRGHRRRLRPRHFPRAPRSDL
jgi:signal transduction histidine kinase